MKPRIGLSCATADGGDGTFALRCAANISYLNWVDRLGAVPLLLPNVSPDSAGAMLDVIDGLLLTGGADLAPLLYGQEPIKQMGAVDVPRDRFELPLAGEALRRELPILGICRGIQTLNVAAGGTLRQDLVSDSAAWVQHGMKVAGGATVQHTVDITAGSRLRGLLGHDQVAVNSYHHQAVGELAPGFQVCATAKDGTVEAIEGVGERFLLGVQWHPEIMTPGEPVSEAVFAAFLAACAV